MQSEGWFRDVSGFASVDHIRLRVGASVSVNACVCAH